MTFLCSSGIRRLCGGESEREIFEDQMSGAMIYVSRSIDEFRSVCGK